MDKHQLPEGTTWPDLDIAWPHDHAICEMSDGSTTWLAQLGGKWIWMTYNYGDSYMVREATDEEVIDALFATVIERYTEAESSRHLLDLGRAIVRAVKKKA